jgi:hypothetical protein
MGGQKRLHDPSLDPVSPPVDQPDLAETVAPSLPEVLVDDRRDVGGGERVQVERILDGNAHRLRLGHASGSGAVAPSDARAGHQVRLPVLETREILPRKLALSEGRRAFEEGDVDQTDPLGARRLRDLLGDHLPHEWDGDPCEPMDDFVGAADGRAG